MDRKEIEHANQLIMDSFRNHDASSVASVYAEDAMMLPPGSEFVYGRPTIEKVFQSIFDGGLEEIILETETYTDIGETVLEAGHYELRVKGQVVDHGKMVVHWREIEGRAQICADTIISWGPPKKEASQ